ncbi:MAG: RIP metalloprotease RseP [Clostridium sp.]|nr:RIP metalloprotease RseP [Acetatifactor muris]MCM1527737.1 RIP metalloprotease RseP [Bacteroides sp.]MCM1563732.1 RIP metalloprotease RseP [Clostridium sp.]
MRIETIIIFIIIFGLVVISHEMGHFLLAKAGGIHVVEFAVGMGPTLFSFKKGNTKYSLKLLPIGGACMFEGEDGLNLKEGEPNPGAFPNANVWKRISTVAAGPIFNFILSFVIALAMVNMIVIRDPVATEVLEGGAAMEAGLQDGDRIIALNGERIRLYEEILLFNTLYRGGDVELVYERGGARYTTTITPKYSEENGRYMMGFSNADFVELQGLDALKYAYYELRYNVKNTYKSLGMLLSGQVSRKDVAGPVGIANVVEQTYEQAVVYGWKDVLVNMMNITLMLSVNLGIINLLPLPALDGGRLVFLALEVIRGKPVPPDKEGMVHFIGLMFFMILMVFIFFNDLANVFGV